MVASQAWYPFGRITEVKLSSLDSGTPLYAVILQKRTGQVLSYLWRVCLLSCRTSSYALWGWSSSDSVFPHYDCISSKLPSDEGNPVETVACYVFDQGYNFFLQLYRTECAGAFFVVRANKNLQYKGTWWKRRMPKGVLSDSIIEMVTYKSRTDCRSAFHLVPFPAQTFLKESWLSGRLQWL